MQPGSGRGNGAGLARVDRLVPIVVCGLGSPLANVSGQRDVAKLFQHNRGRTGQVGPDEPVPFGSLAQQFESERARLYRNHLAFNQAAAAGAENLPCTAFDEP